MTLEQLIEKYQRDYDLIDVINLDNWYALAPMERPQWLRDKLSQVYRAQYKDNQRLVFTLSQGDEYVSQSAPAGVILTNLQEQLNQIDISNFFVVLLTNSPGQIKPSIAAISSASTDSIPITVEYFDGELDQKRITSDKRNLGYNYNSLRPIKIGIDQLSQSQQQLLFENKNFCIYPWVHMHVEPTGQVYPCCGSTYNEHSVIGSTNHTPLREIWNDKPLRDLRLRMLKNQPSQSCNRCYEQEASGFFSMRNSANKHHGHHIDRAESTKPDGTVDEFQMIYWDVRFSNLCNLKCRSCGHRFSSSWFQDQVQIAPGHDKNHKALIFAGKYETDLWEQLIEHIDYVEQIYFAGGEPLMMDEHYRILEELERRGKFDVRLIYNTNFTQIKLKDRLVFDYWRKFDSVSVGASLDAMGQRGEYIRKGTTWQEVENNRRLMIELCPRVDFYVSATLSILNAWHVPDFHRDWCDQGLIEPKDLNINILTDPEFYRLDIAPSSYKQEIERKYRTHLAWLTPKDSLRRASNGFESAIAFMNAQNNSQLLEMFWNKTIQMDKIRNESLLEAIPELSALK
jgi:radical SAM protein with 4Fe4S-binding SPASM domain